MARIAAFISNMFEDVEYTDPAKAFTEAGHEIVNLGAGTMDAVKGKHGTTVPINCKVTAASVEDFDALFIPGGYSPDQLRVDEVAVEYARAFMQSGKPVLSICHGPQLLITADVLKGRKVTGYKSIIKDIKNAGAEFHDQEVVVDGNLVSSRNPQDIPAFIDASLKMLAKVKEPA